MLNTIEEVLAELRAGRPVLVTDDADRENEGDAILAAELADPRWVGWMVRHTSGYLCAPMTEERADQLDLPSCGRRARTHCALATPLLSTRPTGSPQGSTPSSVPVPPGSWPILPPPRRTWCVPVTCCLCGLGLGSVGEARPH